MAASSHADTVVVFTLANPAVRESTRRVCELSGLMHVDLLGRNKSTYADRRYVLAAGQLKRPVLGAGAWVDGN